MCISHLGNRRLGAKDSPLSRSRFIQSFPRQCFAPRVAAALPGSRGREGECVYWIRPLSFSSSSMSVPLAFFRTIFRSSRSLKVSLISVMGFLSMA